MSETSLLISSLLPLRVTCGIAVLRPGKWRSVFLLGCMIFLVVGGTTANARPRRAPLKFEIQPVDSVTGKPRSKFLLGERVSVVFTLTNQSRVARVITQLPDTSIPFKLTSLLDDEDVPDTYEGWLGGTGGSDVGGDGTILWTERPTRKMTLSPGQTVSVTIDDLGRAFARRLQDGNHTLTATYNSSLKAAASFRIVIDEAKSIPLLEQLAAAPVLNGDESDRIWANSYLRQIRQPSISGRIIDAAGKPLKGIWINITGSEKMNIETRANGRYHLTQMTPGVTYTITPSVPSHGGPGEASYKIDPPNRTISNLNTKITEVNFTVTRIPVHVNIALESEGAKARASSILSESDYSVESVIDDSRDASGWGGGNDGWNDGTPNAFPDWIEINWSSTKTIDQINVFTLADNYGHRPAASDINETFSKYGITDFDVQYWNRNVWKNVPGGTIRGNRNVWRTIEFPTIATNKIRVVVSNALAGHSRITEIEAFHTNDLPKVGILARDKGKTGAILQFGTEAFDRDGTIRNYKLNFGDNSTDYEWNRGDKATGNKPKLAHQHIYAEAGIYTVTLSVVDNNDDVSEAFTTVTITDPPKSPAARARRSLRGNAGHNRK